MINLPIFRAKKLNSDEYVVGFLYQDLICYIPSDGFKPDEYKKAVNTETWFIMDNLLNTSMIDISTLSIHFPDMLDSQSNKIFASLQEDGKGGDIVKIRDSDFKYVYKYIKGRFMLDSMELMNPYLLFQKIGIQE